jgi:hypothetical protein
VPARWLHGQPSIDHPPQASSSSWQRTTLTPDPGRC